MGKSDILLRIGASATGLHKKLNAVERRVQRTIDRLETNGRRITSSITLPMAAIGAGTIGKAAEVDKLKKGLEGIMQDAGAAADEFTKLTKLSKNNGLNLKSAVEGSLKLQTIGYSADESREKLDALANAVALAGKSGEDLDGVTTAIQQIISKGKVHAEEINQMAERLPQVRSAMIEAFGTANTEVLQKMQISAKTFVDTIVDGLGDLDRAPDNLANKLSNMRDQFTLMSAQLGTKLFPIFERLMGAVFKVASYFTNLSSETQMNIVKFGFLAAAIGPAKIAIAGLLQVMKTMVSLGKAAFLNPYILALAALGAGAYYAYKNWDSFRDKIVDVTNTIIGFINNHQWLRLVLESVITTAKNLFAAFELVGKSVYNTGRLMKEFWLSSATLGIKGDMKGVLSDWGDDFEDFTKTIGDNTKELADMMHNGVVPLDKITGDDVDSAVAPLKNAFKEAEKYYNDFMNLFSGGFGGGAIRDRVKTTGLENPILDAENRLKSWSPELPKVQIEIDDRPFINKLLEMSDTFAQAVEKMSDIASQVFSQLDGISSQYFTNQDQRIENHYARQEKLINSSLMSEAQKNEMITKLETQKEQRSAELKRKEARANKGLAIFDSILNGARAVTAALAAGPVLGPIMAGVIGSMAAVQTALIASQPLPALAKGGAAFGLTTAVIGDNPNPRGNPEVVAPFQTVTNMFDNYVRKAYGHSAGRSNSGGTNLNRAFRVAGNDLELINARSAERKLRMYG